MKSKGFIFRSLLVLAMFIAAAIFYPQLPEQIPIHWNVQGIADDWGNKAWAAWLTPGLSLLMLLLLPLLAKIDPRKKNYEKFSGAFEMIQTLLILFFTFIFGVQYFLTLRPEYEGLMPSLMLTAMGLMFVGLGNYMGKVRQNYFVGVRTPWTLADPEVWQKSQRVTGWAFVLGGLIFLIQAWFQAYLTLTFILVIAMIVVLPIVYSFVIFKQKNP